MIDPTALLVALIAAVPASIAAWSAFRANRRVKTSNGGETIAELLENHTVVDQANFERLNQGQEALWEGLGVLKAHIELARKERGTNPPME